MDTSAAATNKEKKDDIRNPRFSPDGKSIIFDRCSPEYFERCRIHVYNLETGHLGYYLPPQGQVWMQGYIADSGDKLAFVTMPVGDRNKDMFTDRYNIFPKSQIAVMNLDGSNLRVVTNVAGYKGMPAFSHSGNKILFTQAERLRDSGHTMAAFWDLWELDLETGTLGLFAGQHKFYQMGLSTYFADDRRVLANGDSPSSQRDALGLDSFSYIKRYNNSSIFIVKRDQTVLDAPLFTDTSSSSIPCMDTQGNIYYEGSGAKEGIKIRRYGKDGQKTTWPHPPLPPDGGGFFSMAVSADGKQLAMSVGHGDLPQHDTRLMLLDTVTGQWRHIPLPNNATQINR